MMIVLAAMTCLILLRCSDQAISIFNTTTIDDYKAKHKHNCNKKWTLLQILQTKKYFSLLATNFSVSAPLHLTTPFPFFSAAFSVLSLRPGLRAIFYPVLRLQTLSVHACAFPPHTTAQFTFINPAENSHVVEVSVSVSGKLGKGYRCYRRKFMNCARFESFHVCEGVWSVSPFFVVE